MRKNPILRIGAGMFAVLLILVFAGPYLPFIDRHLTAVSHRWSADKHLILPPYDYSSQNLLGSNKQGVDNLSRVVVGARPTLGIVLCVSALRYAIGIPLGLMARARRGPVHTLLTGMNRLFAYMPPLLMIAMLAGLPLVVYSSSRLFWMILFMTLVEIGRVGYIVQRQTAAIAAESYVEAGNALGLKPWRLFRAYYLPALLPELAVNFCLDLGKVMMLLGQLGLLGIYLNVSPEQLGTVGQFGRGYTGSDWGAMISDHLYDLFVSKFRYVLIPSFAILYVVLTFNVLGEGLRRKFNAVGRAGS
ncbi:ABC transporter permease subunit [Saccharibacillus sp. CPCC 101409]|uniref:ABC transporter permease n=1 Tax=Saccharibacillus sp. CPCC 101409 TaxID=3058041 RepID=UPI002674182E|nr:ABC transporter permease subunit [Saccharibacillus sp. CPCC 101409]MDO3408719.1 ABC transporter permease subunit [Saccharibacillus sp. CPCC 101409]